MSPSLLSRLKHRGRDRGAMNSSEFIAPREGDRGTDTAASSTWTPAPPTGTGLE